MVWGSRDVDPTITDMLRHILATLEAVETTQRRGKCIIDYVSNEESKEDIIVNDENVLEQGDELFLIDLTRVNS